MHLIHEFNWQSQSLGKPTAVSLAVPEGDAPREGWPLVLLLHGRGRDHRSITAHPRFQAWIEHKRFSLVCPHGDDGWWIDSPAARNSRYQSMLVELLEHARTRAPLTHRADRTGVMGWSMGGFGAAKFATDHPREIAALATLIALLDFPVAGDPIYQTPAVFGTPEQAILFNPLLKIESIREKAVCILAAKQAWDFPMNERFHDELNRVKITHRYITFDGEHHLSAVEYAVPIAFDFMHQQLAANL